MTTMNINHIMKCSENFKKSDKKGTYSKYVNGYYLKNDRFCTKCDEFCDKYTADGCTQN